MTRKIRKFHRLRRKLCKNLHHSLPFGDLRMVRQPLSLLVKCVDIRLLKPGTSGQIQRALTQRKLREKGEQKSLRRL